MDWGLAWSEAAPYAADLGMKYEKARRYDAEGKLFDLELQEKMEQTEHATDLNRDVRAAQKAITDNKKGILAGDIDSYLKAKNALASGTGYTWVKLDGSNIGLRAADGTINKDTIRDLSSKEWKNPAARIAELEKSAKSVMDIASQYRSAVEKNEKDAWEREKFYIEEKGKNQRNEADNRTRIAVAKLGLMAKDAGSGKEGKAISWDEKHSAEADNQAASAVLGINVSSKRDDNNTLRFYDAHTGAEVPVNDEKRQEISKASNWIKQESNKLAIKENLAPYLAISHMGLFLRDDISRTKAYNTALYAKQKAEAAGIVARGLRNSTPTETNETVYPWGGMPYTIEKPSTHSVSGKITTNGPPTSGLGVTGLVGSEWNTPVETYRRSVLGDTYM